MKTIYNFSVQDAELKDIPIKDYKDKVKRWQAKGTRSS